MTAKGRETMSRAPVLSDARREAVERAMCVMVGIVERMREVATLDGAAELVLEIVALADEVEASCVE
jgi:hypothetical protein